MHLLAGDVLVLDTAVDETGQLVGRLPDVGRLLGDGELLEELVKDLDGLSVLGRHDGLFSVGVLGRKKKLSINDEEIETLETIQRLSRIYPEAYIREARRDRWRVDSALSRLFLCGAGLAGLLGWRRIQTNNSTTKE